MSNPAITVENLSKRYIIGHQRSKDDGIRHVIEDAVRAPFKWLRSGGTRKRVQKEEFWALQKVSFEVKQGEVVGIIGRNGAGKSTLLKLLSRITEPTIGRISIDGRVASLLEVGTGFHQELTGRENVFLNGAILGMSRIEIKRKFDEIVAFAEVEKFLDTPVKRYSSGMYVRLAFAVAAHLEPEVLIVDEVLSVGDAQFQSKCMGKMQDVATDGRTILFVSHNMQAVASLCQRAAWLRNGRLVAEGNSREMIAAYLAADFQQQQPEELAVDKRPRTGTGAARFTSLTVRRIPDPRPGGILVQGDSVCIELAINSISGIKECNVGITIYDSYAYRLIDANTALKGEFLSLKAGEAAKVSFTLHDLLIKPGRYVIELWLGRGGVEDVDFVKEAGELVMHDNPEASRHTEIFPGTYQCRFSHSIIK